MPPFSFTEWLAIIAALGGCMTALLTQLLLVLRGLREMRAELKIVHDQTNHQLDTLRDQLLHSQSLLQEALLHIARLEARVPFERHPEGSRPGEP